MSTQDKADTIDKILKTNVDGMESLEEQSKYDRSRSEKIADLIAHNCGTIVFAWANFIWFFSWVFLNTLLPKTWHFDPYPFQFLTFMVSLEAIFLSVFILISENRQSKMDESRNKLDLQVNLLAEQENTKTLQILNLIAQKMEIDVTDHEIHTLAERSVSPEDISKHMKEKENANQTKAAGK